MIKKTITVDETIEFLNKQLKVDPDNIHKIHSDASDQPSVLALLNELFGRDDNGMGPIAAVLMNGQIISFTKTTKPVSVFDPLPYNMNNEWDKANAELDDFEAGGQ